MFAHFGTRLVQLSAGGITVLVFNRVEPGAEKIGADAYHYFRIFENISRNGALTVSGFIGQQHTAVRNRIELYMAAVIFFYKFVDDQFCSRRSDSAGKQYNGSTI